MVGIGRLVVVAFMTAETIIGSSRVITVMASVTFIGNSGMCPRQRIIISMDWECSRFPAWICSVTCLAGGD